MIILLKAATFVSQLLVWTHTHTHTDYVQVNICYFLISVIKQLAERKTFQIYFSEEVLSSLEIWNPNNVIVLCFIITWPFGHFYNVVVYWNIILEYE